MHRLTVEKVFNNKSHLVCKFLYFPQVSSHGIVLEDQGWIHISRSYRIFLEVVLNASQVFGLKEEVQAFHPTFNIRLCHNR